jgi:hypothetical protein
MPATPCPHPRLTGPPGAAYRGSVVRRGQLSPARWPCAREPRRRRRPAESPRQIGSPNREQAYVPAEQSPSREDSRLSAAYAYPGGPGHSCRAARQGPHQAVCLRGPCRAAGRKPVAAAPGVCHRDPPGPSSRPPAPRRPSSCGRWAGRAGRRAHRGSGGTYGGASSHPQPGQAPAPAPASRPGGPAARRCLAGRARVAGRGRCRLHRAGSGAGRRAGERGSEADDCHGVARAGGSANPQGGPGASCWSAAGPAEEGVS